MMESQADVFCYYSLSCVPPITTHTLRKIFFMGEVVTRDRVTRVFLSRRANRVAFAIICRETKHPGTTDDRVCLSQFT